MFRRARNNAARNEKKASSLMKAPSLILRKSAIPFCAVDPAGCEGDFRHSKNARRDLFAMTAARIGYGLMVKRKRHYRAMGQLRTTMRR